MKVLFLNPPYPARLTRRYMCTYVSAVSLFPPYELMSVAGVVREMPDTEVKLIDCVAGNINDLQLLDEIRSFRPDVILTLIGLESFTIDTNCVRLIKENFPEPVQVIFGHYPTLFPEEILSKVPADIIIKGEPDETLQDIIEALQEKRTWADVAGIAYRSEVDAVKVTPNKGRIKDLNKFPLPAHDLINAHNYYEPMMPGPFAMIQTSRGCPFSCNYCITSFGTKFVTKSAEVVIGELKLLKQLHNISSFRIIDDTFTINKSRVIQICQAMIDEGLDLKWSCLSRADTVSLEMLEWMKRAGCVRIYFGLESGSQRILDYYKKGIVLETARQTLDWCDQVGIESAGLFMAGLPEETEADLDATIQFAVRSGLTYAGVGELTPYPGTELYELLKDQVEFSLFPYVHRFKDPSITEKAMRYRDLFHQRFYMRKRSLWKLSGIALKDIPNAVLLVRRIVSARNYGTKLYPYLHN